MTSYGNLSTQNLFVQNCFFLLFPIKNIKFCCCKTLRQKRKFSWKCFHNLLNRMRGFFLCKLSTFLFVFLIHSEPYSSVRWIGSDDKLIADSRQTLYLVPNRILNTNGSLEVTNIKLEDTGEFICEITIGGRRVITQLHSLEVQGERKRRF